MSPSHITMAIIKRLTVDEIQKRESSPTVLRIEVTADTVEYSVDVPENPEDAVIL